MRNIPPPPVPPLEGENRPENVTESLGFDIDAALDKKGFAEFLAQHPGAENFDMDDAGEIQKRFEVFEIKDNVSKGLEKIYASHIQDQIGIKLEAGDAKSVKDHIEKLAVSEPEKVHELNEKLKMFLEVPNEIKSLETELVKLGDVGDLKGKLAEAALLKTDLEAVIPTIGSLKYKAKYAFAMLTLAPLRGWKGFDEVAYVEAAKNKFNFEYGEQKKPGKGDKVADKQKLYSVMMDTSQKIDDIKAVLEKIEATEDLKSTLKTSFDAARKNLISGMAEIKGLTEAINKRSCAELEKMMQPGTLGALQKSQEKLELLQFAAVNPDIGMEPLTTADVERLQKKIDEIAESNIPKQIFDIVLDADLGVNALTKFEKALDPFLKTNHIGSKEGDSARAFIRETIEKIVAIEPETPEGKVKRIILKRILVKLAKS